MKIGRHNRCTIYYIVSVFSFNLISSFCSRHAVLFPAMFVPASTKIVFQPAFLFPDVNKSRAKITVPERAPGVVSEI